MLAAAWNGKGTLVAAGWAVPNPKAPEAAVVLDADGKEVSRPKEAGAVMGVAFAPGTDTLLIGADQQRIRARCEGNAHDGTRFLRPRYFLTVGVQHHSGFRRLGIRDGPAGRDERTLTIPRRRQHLVGGRDFALLIPVSYTHL